MGNNHSDADETAVDEHPKIYRSVSEELWDKAFTHVNERSHKILENANEQSRNGRDLDDIREWCQGEVGRLTLLCPEILELLWKKYDANRDGVLQQTELRSLIQDYLLHARKEIPNELVRIFNDHLEQAGMTKEEIRTYMQNPDVSDLLDTARVDLTTKINTWLKDLESVTGKVHERLDKNRDGAVSKEEFFAEFPSVCDKVCNLSQFKDTLFRLSCLGAEEHSQVYND